MPSAPHDLHFAHLAAPSRYAAVTGMPRRNRLLPALLAATLFCLPQTARAQAGASSTATAAATSPTAATTSSQTGAPDQAGTPKQAGTRNQAGAPNQADAPSVPDLQAESATLAAPAVAASPTWTRHGLLSSTSWGGRGLVDVASAYPLSKGALALAVRGDYARAPNLFLSGDLDVGASQGMALAYSPVQGLELGLGVESIANNYRGPVPRDLQLQGNPTARVKYGHHVAGPLALGALLTATVPTVQGSAAAHSRAVAATATGLLSLQPVPRLELLANVGYHFDRSRHVFRDEVPDVVQRFVFGINGTQSVRWGAGLTGRVSLGQTVDLLPFAEVNGELGLVRTATFKNSPLRATAGLRGYPTRSRAVELAVGSEVRLSGAPRIGSPFAGLPPWRAFAQLTVHLGEQTLAPTAVADAAPTFRIRGRATDADTGQPLMGAALHVAGDAERLMFGVDEQTGHFVSTPQAVGEGNVKLVAHAPGYQDTEVVVTRPRNATDVEVDVMLSAETHGSKQALLKGSVKDADTGEAILGAEVQVAALKRTLLTKQGGTFAALLKPGPYIVWIRATGYEPQRKVLTLRAGESMVLNLDVYPLTSK